MYILYHIVYLLTRCVQQISGPLVSGQLLESPTLFAAAAPVPLIPATYAFVDSPYAQVQVESDPLVTGTDVPPQQYPGWQSKI